MTEKKHIEELLELFLDAQTTEKQEAELARFFKETENIPQEWKAYRDMFRTFETRDTLLTAEELAEAEALLPPRKTVGHNRFRWAYAAAAAVIAFVAGTLTMKHFNHPHITETAIVAQAGQSATPPPLHETTAPTTGTPESHVQTAPAETRTAKAEAAPSRPARKSATPVQPEEDKKRAGEEKPPTPLMISDINMELAMASESIDLLEENLTHGNIILF